MTLATFTLTSPAAQVAPFTVGQAFKRGDVPAGAGIVASIPNVQVIGKNAWPDGSMKFAIVSGRAPLAANVPLSVALSIGAPTAGVALTLANLKATGIAASIGASTFGSASWSGADWSSPFMAWISGPQMSSWIYRKPIGSDAHLVGWLEVRLYAGGAVDVLPWIENGYLNVAGPTNKAATYKFTLGGTERFSAAIDLPNHGRTPLVSGATQSHWLGADPFVTPAHDGAYTQATRLVPAYMVATNEKVLAGLTQTAAPMQTADYPAGMGAAGYHASIGLLPEWDVAYLTTSDARAYRSVIVNAYAAGRYGIHYRDETTNRPLRFSAYPNLVMGGGSSVPGGGSSTKGASTPNATGTVPATYNTTHHPSIGFTAYLATGRFYFMEQLQFAATLNFLKNPDHARQASAGVFLSTSGSNTTRGAAWAIRTLAQAACVTPDDDILRAEFVASMSANADYYHARYVAQPNNPFGFVTPYSNYTVGKGKYSEAAWMQDFFTAATGYAICLGLGLPAASADRLTAFFAWKAQSIIGRLGGTGPSDYLYRDAGVYAITVAPGEAPDFNTGKGPWYPSWGALYAATLGHAPDGVGGDLRGGNFPEASSYWGNMQPAIAYAVEHRVPGAAEAYARMTSAPNFNQLQAGFAATPVWAVVVGASAPLKPTPPPAPPPVIAPPVIVPPPAPTIGKITTPSNVKLAKLKNLTVTLFDPATLAAVQSFANLPATSRGALTFSGASIIHGQRYAAAVADSSGRVLDIAFPLLAEIL